MEASNAGHFGFSAVSMNDLGATEYTLVTLVVDRSSSTYGFQLEMEKCLKTILDACRKSPRANNLMLRLVTFDSNHQEVHGFKLLQDCNADDYDGVLTPRGQTALVDACVNAIEAAASYAKSLTENDFDVNAITFIITDGWENRSSLTISQLQKVIKDISVNESMESLITVLIGVNAQYASSDLLKFRNDVGLNEYIDLKDATPKTLARLAQFVSSSITSHSQSLQSGSVTSLSF